MEKPDTYKTNKVRFEMMKRLGYFVTESSEHNAEYNPWFIPRGKQMVEKFDVPIDEYLRRCDGIVDEFERMKTLSKNDEPIEVHRSHEYGSTIIHSIVTGKPSVVYGNMPNGGAIANLPATAIAEVPTLVDRSGLHLTTVGELPPQLIGYMQPHVTQHELFIRAALEGRRDHVYQAAMFDPLTAATLSTDKIVEMCDELIAAHGDLLPALDTKKTLVPHSGKPFGLVDPKRLRRSWDAAQLEAGKDFLVDWHVIGPFGQTVGGTAGKISLDFKTPIEDEFLRRGDGSVDLEKWKIAKASRKNGAVNLAQELGAHEWCVAYGYAEIESVHPREALLKCGSDDGIKLWLNGKLIHTHEKGRAYNPGSDEVAIYLKAGVNRLLVKCDNYTGGWAFGVSIPRANF
jgi:hypothetical protein